MTTPESKAKQKTIINYSPPSLSHSFNWIAMPLPYNKKVHWFTEPGGFFFRLFIFITGHVLLLCPFSWHSLQLYVLLRLVWLTFVSILGQFRRLWPFSSQILQRYCLTLLLSLVILSPLIKFRLNTLPDFEQFLLLWPLPPHIVQRCWIVALIGLPFNLDFLQVLLLWPFSPHTRHLNRLSIESPLSSGQ